MPNNPSYFVQIAGPVVRNADELADIARKKLLHAARSGNPTKFQFAVESYGEYLADDEIDAFRAQLDEVSRDQVARREERRQRRKVTFLAEQIVGEWNQAMKDAAEKEARRRLGLADEGGAEV